MPLRYLTSGESHGRQLTAIIEGVPSGLPVTAAYINAELKRRQSGWGRGARMRIESDCVEIVAGVRHGLTLGSPIALVIHNRDWDNWKGTMSSEALEGVSHERMVTRPRPGHADLTGGIKYGHRDLRNILERSSARETAARVAATAIGRRLIEEFGIKVMSWVTEIGGVKWCSSAVKTERDMNSSFKKAEASDVRCPDPSVAEAMKMVIDAARAGEDSVGGTFDVILTGVPPGLGSHVHWDRKLDGRLAGALMSIQAIKGVEVGVGFGAASRLGSTVHDEIFFKRQGKAKGKYWPSMRTFYRKTNNAGGIEGGMSNGEPLLLRAVMKPIPTLYKPLRSVDINTKAPFKATVERSDICAVPAASVIAESVAAFEAASLFLEKFGGDSIAELERNYAGYLKQVADY